MPRFDASEANAQRGGYETKSHVRISGWFKSHTDSWALLLVSLFKKPWNWEGYFLVFCLSWFLVLFDKCQDESKTTYLLASMSLLLIWSRIHSHKAFFLFTAHTLILKCKSIMIYLNLCLFIYMCIRIHGSKAHSMLVWWFKPKILALRRVITPWNVMNIRLSCLAYVMSSRPV